jgi:hypothetical protein
MNLVRAGAPGNGSVDSCITDLVKALDAMCERHGLTRISLLKELDSARASAVEVITADAREKLKSLRRRCKADGDLDQLPAIDRIISRQANVAAFEGDFGIALTALLGRLGLHDATAMNAYYSTLAADVTWEGILSTIRGQVIHYGAIRVNARNELFTWFNFARHLHDICKRVILLDIGYKGTYDASNVTFTGSYELHRIAPDTKVSDLGYTTPPISA